MKWYEMHKVTWMDQQGCLRWSEMVLDWYEIV